MFLNQPVASLGVELRQRKKEDQPVPYLEITNRAFKKWYLVPLWGYRLPSKNQTPKGIVTRIRMHFITLLRKLFRWHSVACILEMELVKWYFTHYLPAMPFGNRKFYFRGSFQFSIVTIWKISPLRKPEFFLFRYFPKLKVAHFNGGKIQFLLS